MKNNEIISYILKKFQLNNTRDLEESLDDELQKNFQDIIKDLNIEKATTIEHLERISLENLRKILETKLKESSFLKKLITNP